MEASSERRRAPARAGAFLAGGLPLLVFGWTASAVANQLSFAVWGLVAATVYAVLLRAAWGAGWRTARVVGTALFWLAVGWGVDACLAWRHAEILELAGQAWPLGGLLTGNASYVTGAVGAVLAVFFLAGRDASARRKSGAAAVR